MDYTDVQECLEKMEERFRMQEEQILFLTHKIGGPIYSRYEDNISCHMGYSVTYEEYKRHSALHVLRRHVRDFWNSVSLPGFKYVGEPGRPRTDRYIWIVLIIMGLFVSARYIENAYTKWQGSPVFLSFNETLTPIAHIPFPAVTVCPGRQLYNERSLQHIIDLWKKDINITQEQKVILSAAGLLCPESYVLKLGDFSTRYYDRSFLDSLNEVFLKCENVIYAFRFGKYIFGVGRTDCRLDFKTLYSDGNVICFTFNMLPAKDMFKENVLSPVMTEAENVLEKNKSNWTPDSIFKMTDHSTSIPFYVTENDISSGLKLRISPDNDSGICGYNKTSKIYIHHPAELPMLQIDSGVDLTQEKELRVRLYPSVTTTSEELREYNPKTRGCYFSDERQLSLFKFYTRKNCQMECEVNCSLSICDCVPLYHPRKCKVASKKNVLPKSINSSVKICRTTGRISCSPYLVRGMNLTDEVLSENFPDCRCDCLAECTSVRYDFKVEGGSPQHEGITTISFKDLEVTALIRKELIGVTDFIADSGGVLGVFTGFSFMALFELIYYLTFRLWSSIKQASEDERVGSGAEGRVDVTSSRSAGDEVINVSSSYCLEIQ